MKSLKAFLFFFAVAVALTAPSKAQFGSFTNSTDFFNAITASNYTETYNGFAFESDPNPPQNFNSNGFSYTALTGSGNFFMINSSDRWLSTFEVTTISFTNFSANISAIGGNFFATQFDQTYTNTPIALTATLSDSSTFSTNYLPVGTNSYFGLVFTTNIVSLTISNAPASAEFMTVNNLTVGVVPEPSTYALLGLAATALAGYVVRRRRA